MAAGEGEHTEAAGRGSRRAARAARAAGAFRNVAFLLALGPLLLPGCDGDRSGGEEDGSSLSIVLNFETPAGGDVVWMGDHAGAGDMLLVEILARDVSQPFDRFVLEVCFDPLVVESLGYTSAAFLQTCAGSFAIVLAPQEMDCSAVPGLRARFVSEVVTGQSPPACLLTGTEVLGTLSFRARGAGTSALMFVPFNGDPASPEGSALLRGDSPAVSLPVQFFDTGTEVDVMP